TEYWCEGCATDPKVWMTYDIYGNLEKLYVAIVMSVKDAVQQINNAVLNMAYGDLVEVVEFQKAMALEERFTYLLGPIKIALRPRVITYDQLEALKNYCNAMWVDCLTLEKMWLSGELDHLVNIEPEELEIARLQPWHGSAAIIASDGLFNFGTEMESL
ncbi:MAG: hypothetical protein SVY10_21245, partial [Thermodesulfobacteriota bacterium]|nr:hypothetical protein [Thermodesulfobacteriota bacterium]